MLIAIEWVIKILACAFAFGFYCKYFFRTSTNVHPNDLFDCDCSVHDITTPGAAHAVDCPRYD